tara:strand:+ start:3223 stop:3396 length:174 start_codon:yes stop_codon:yes gene_type:complete
MAKKIRLMDEPEAKDGMEGTEIDDANQDKFLKYAEAIDWKLWEILKLMRKQAGEPEA